MPVDKVHTMADAEPGKPDFLQCCLVCNTEVKQLDRPQRRLDGIECREFLASLICPAARDELATIDLICDKCLAIVEQWNSARHTLKKLQSTITTKYRASRQRRNVSVLSLHMDRMVVQMPYTVFLMNAKGFSSAWPELVQQVAAAVLESAGIAPRPRSGVAPSPPPPPPLPPPRRRVGFEGLKEQAARARDLEETLSILSVADTASLLDRTETLSVFSDTADLSTLADDNWTSLELAPSVSFAEPSAGDRMPGRKTADKGEDLLREFAETMSNISEGVPRDAAGKLRCAECGRPFSRRSTLREHERLHRGGGHPCTVCGKAFPSKSDLARHADSHRSEKLYKCADCGKAFQVSSSLARHRTLHTDRAATCELCGKLFDRKDTMLKHRETHKTNNEHGCALCGKMYKQRRILAKHMRLIHGGPGAHVCEVCQKQFKTNYDMLGHVRRMHAKAESNAD
ncbi:zinc finger protein 133-like [Pollicipes pollicipes]|uniref:zinc finger protein 133-like n=1 Tax=Pollicipes pollicipes TaxID=41117 RepID=UPI0018856950|nr:zinc finger protein 133-like [Pollicipes pollicipes]